MRIPFFLAAERAKEKEEDMVRGEGKEPCRIGSRKAQKSISVQFCQLHSGKIKSAPWEKKVCTNIVYFSYHRLSPMTISRAGIQNQAGFAAVKLL